MGRFWGLWRGSNSADDQKCICLFHSMGVIIDLVSPCELSPKTSINRNKGP